jgi:predicted PurR-regulated permease PerM
MDLKAFNNFPFYVKLAAVLFSLLAMGYIVIIAKELLAPLIFSCLFSILLLPVAAFFEYKLRLPRSAASMVAVVLLLTFIGVLIYVIGSQIADLFKEWPQFQAQIKSSLWEFRGWVQDNFHITRGKQLRVASEATSKVLSPDTAAVGATVLSVSAILVVPGVHVYLYVFLFIVPHAYYEVPGVCFPEGKQDYRS